MATTLASGTRFSTSFAIFSMVSISLCRKYICPPRFNSREIASISVGLCHCVIKVLIAKRRVGGVLINDYNIFR